jgi:CheY-like chemotaxis protein
VIFISALHETLDKVKGFRVGGLDYVTKPFQFEEVHARVETHLKLRRLQLQLREQNAVLQGANCILEQSLKAPSLEALGEACLHVVEVITGSRTGFIGEIGADGCLHDVAISNPCPNACKMSDHRGHRNPPGNFPVHGIYGRVLADGKSLIVNDPSSHPDRIGVPSGHPPLTAFLGVPLVEEGRVVGMIAVGNRSGGYRQEDLESLEILAPSVSQAMGRKRAEQAKKPRRPNWPAPTRTWRPSPTSPATTSRNRCEWLPAS